MHAQHHRAGKGFLKFIISVVVVAAVAYIAWFAFVNKTTDPNALLDPDKHQAAIDETQPYIEKTAGFLKKITDETFGDGGLIDQASEWMDSSDQAAPVATQPGSTEPAAAPPSTSTPQPSTPATQPAPAAPQKSSQTLKLEADIAEAKTLFRGGISAYEAADPANGGWTPERKNNVKQAASSFKKVSNILFATLDKYENLSDHDKRILADARKMQSLNQKLLFNANKMTGL